MNVFFASFSSNFWLVRAKDLPYLVESARVERLHTGSKSLPPFSYPHSFTKPHLWSSRIWASFWPCAPGSLKLVVAKELHTPSGILDSASLMKTCSRRTIRVLSQYVSEKTIRVSLVNSTIPIQPYNHYVLSSKKRSRLFIRDCKLLGLVAVLNTCLAGLPKSRT